MSTDSGRKLTTPSTKKLRRYAKVLKLEHEGFTNPATWMMHTLMNNNYECLCKVDEMYREDKITAPGIKLLVDSMKKMKKHEDSFGMSSWVWNVKESKSFGKSIVATSIDWEQIADEFRKET